MDELTDDQAAVLRAIARIGAGANWHKVGRVVLGHLSSPAAFETVFTELIGAGLVEEVPHDGEPIPRLRLTPKGLSSPAVRGAD